MNQNDFNQPILEHQEWLKTKERDHSSPLRFVASRNCPIGIGQLIWARGVILRGVDFTSADLRGIDFKWASLTNCIFTYAQLDGCDFRGSNLTGSLFLGAYINFAKFDGDTGFTIVCD